MHKILTATIYFFAIIGFVLTIGYFSVKWGFTNTPGIIDKQDEFFQTKNAELQSSTLLSSREQTWSKGEEWEIFTDAVRKDKEAIDQAARETGVESRLIVSQLVVEQLRLYHTNREIFKSVFAPLKLLGNQSQFSWGVMGLKQETAIQIEEHLKDPSSPFYLGKEYEHSLDFETSNPDKERFDRIIDENSRYYSYLYSGFYLKQIINQWENAEFDISERPEIISTLFNIGFTHSKPNANPKVGGAEIVIKDTTYSFGSLAGEFYYSNELLQEFPRK